MLEYWVNVIVTTMVNKCNKTTTHKHQTSFETVRLGVNSSDRLHTCLLSGTWNAEWQTTSMSIYPIFPQLSIILSCRPRLLGCSTRDCLSMAELWAQWIFFFAVPTGPKFLLCGCCGDSEESSHLRPMVVNSGSLLFFCVCVSIIIIIIRQKITHSSLLWN